MLGNPRDRLSGVAGVVDQVQTSMAEEVVGKWKWEQRPMDARQGLVTVAVLWLLC